MNYQGARPPGVCVDDGVEIGGDLSPMDAIVVADVDHDDEIGRIEDRREPASGARPSDPAREEGHPAQFRSSIECVSPMSIDPATTTDRATAPNVVAVVTADDAVLLKGCLEAIGRQGDGPAKVVVVAGDEVVRR